MISRVAKPSADDQHARRVVMATAQPGRGIPEIGLSSAGRAMQDVPDRRLPRWLLRSLIGIGLAVFLVVFSLALLGLVDFSMAGDGSYGRPRTIQHQATRDPRVTRDNRYLAQRGRTW